MPPRHLLVTTGVVAAHFLALYLLQQGISYQVDAPVVPAEILVEWLPAPQTDTVVPVQTPPKPAAQRRPEPALVPARPQAVAPRPMTAAPSDLVAPAPSPSVVVPQATGVPAVHASSTPSAADSAAPSAATAPAAAARVELPSSQADYLNNPHPPYPALSRRLGEQGKVVLRVRIEPDGTASRADVLTSSGYERLDQTALQSVLRWRFVPGKRNGVAEAMWFNVPVNFVLE